jgi:hypothetical protein
MLSFLIHSNLSGLRVHCQSIPPIRMTINRTSDQRCPTHHRFPNEPAGSRRICTSNRTSTRHEQSHNAIYPRPSLIPTLRSRFPINSPLHRPNDDHRDRLQYQPLVHDTYDDGNHGWLPRRWPMFARLGAAAIESIRCFSKHESHSRDIPILSGWFNENAHDRHNSYRAPPILQRSID